MSDHPSGTYGSQPLHNQPMSIVQTSSQYDGVDTAELPSIASISVVANQNGDSASDDYYTNSRNVSAASDAFSNSIRINGARQYSTTATDVHHQRFHQISAIGLQKRRQNALRKRRYQTSAKDAENEVEVHNFVLSGARQHQERPPHQSAASTLDKEASLHTSKKSRKRRAPQNDENDRQTRKNRRDGTIQGTKRVESPSFKHISTSVDFSALNRRNGEHTSKSVASLRESWNGATAECQGISTGATWFPSMAEESHALERGIRDRAHTAMPPFRANANRQGKRNPQQQKRSKAIGNQPLPVRSHKNARFHPLLGELTHKKIRRKKTMVSAMDDDELTDTTRATSPGSRSLFSSLHAYQRHSKVFHSTIHHKKIVSRRQNAPERESQTATGARSPQKKSFHVDESTMPTRSRTADPVLSQSHHHRYAPTLENDDEFDVNDKSAILRMHQMHEQQMREKQAKVARKRRNQTSHFVEDFHQSQTNDSTSQNGSQASRAVASHHPHSVTFQEPSHQFASRNYDANETVPGSYLDQLHQHYSKQKPVLHSEQVYSFMDTGAISPDLSHDSMSMLSREENVGTSMKILPSHVLDEPSPDAHHVLDSTVQDRPSKNRKSSKAPRMDAFQSPAYHEKILFESHNKRFHITPSEYFSTLRPYASKSPIIWQNPSLKKIHEYRLSTPPLHSRRDFENDPKGAKKSQSHLIQRKMRLQRAKKSFWRCIDRVVMVNRWRLSKGKPTNGKEQQKLKVVWEDVHWLPEVRCV
uniref:Uncharacterized protein n=1 Tax=Percolomonas cosmopolitus TaxID=63605 RepID=A0A7S1KRV2_9EUKA